MSCKSDRIVVDENKVCLCFAVTSPSPGSSPDIRFGYKSPSLTEQDNGHQNLPRYLSSISICTHCVSVICEGGCPTLSYFRHNF